MLQILISDRIWLVLHIKPSFTAETYNRFIHCNKIASPTICIIVLCQILQNQRIKTRISSLFEPFGSCGVCTGRNIYFVLRPQ